MTNRPRNRVKCTCRFTVESPATEHAAKLARKYAISGKFIGRPRPGPSSYRRRAVLTDRRKRERRRFQELEISFSVSLTIRDAGIRNASARANRLDNVGCLSPRSSIETKVLSKPDSRAKASCDSPFSTRSWRRTVPKFS